ncbi:Hypothetical predicted protein, partial [Mytilus galloprovincialis]
GFQSRSEESSNAVAVGGGVAAFIIVVLIIVAAFIFYKSENQYDDFIRMDPTSPYQDLTTPSVTNDYEQIDNEY